MIMRSLRRPERFVYLQYCVSLEEAKKTYKEYAVKLHPDKGGKLEDMQQLNVEWDYIKQVPILPIVRKSYNSNPTPRPTPPPTPPPSKPKPSTPPKPKQPESTGFGKFYQQFTREEETYTSQNNTDNNVLSDEEFEFIINGLYESAIKSKKRVGSVYFSFIDFVVEQNYTITTSQLKRIASKLGYAPGWVFFQKQDYLNKRNVTVI